MPVTKLDVITALIVIDLQKGIVGLLTAHPMGEVETGTTAEIIHLLENTRNSPGAS